MRTNYKNWHNLWDGGKYGTQENELSLKSLLNLAGFYTITEEAWRAYAEGVINTLGKKDTNAVVLEIGCGTGAFLSVLEPMFEQLWGVDFSEKQISICRQALPKGHFIVAEAAKINLQAGSFDLCLSNSVFQYFPDLDYAETVLNKMLVLLKEDGNGAVLDLTDVEFKNRYIDMKMKHLGKEAYSQFPAQLFFSRQMFVAFAEKNGLKYKIEPQAITNYPNASFRFNFFFWKG